MTKITEHGLGWRRGNPDKRDALFRYSAARDLDIKAKLPARCVNDKWLPAAVLDQGQTSSCTGHATAIEFWSLEMKQMNPDTFRPSPVFAYYNARLVEAGRAGAAGVTDSGASIRDVFKAMVKEGMVPVTEWQLDPSRINVQPPHVVYGDAVHHEALVYQSVPQTLPEMKGCIAAGFGFVLGIGVYSSFMSAKVAKTGLVPVPDVRTEELAGGHAVRAFGYDDAAVMASGKKGGFLIRNSWGITWGQGGNFWLPYDYIGDPDLADEMFTLRKVMV